MADDGKWITHAQVIQKAGAGVSATVTDTYTNAWLLEAEGIMNVATRFNWSTATIDANTKGILSSTTGSFAAILAINFDNSGYNPGEASEMKDVLNTFWLQGLSILRDKKKEKFAKNV